MHTMSLWFAYKTGAFLKYRCVVCRMLCFLCNPHPFDTHHCNIDLATMSDPPSFADTLAASIARERALLLAAEPAAGAAADADAITQMNAQPTAAAPATAVALAATIAAPPTATNPIAAADYYNNSHRRAFYALAFKPKASNAGDMDREAYCDIICVVRRWKSDSLGEKNGEFSDDELRANAKWKSENRKGYAWIRDYHASTLDS